MLQAERFDPHRGYLRRWLPEISALPDALIHRPWVADERVLADEGPLAVVERTGLLEDLVGYRELPEIVQLRCPCQFFELVLAGHFHGGQLAVPTPWGRIRLKDLRATYWEGLFDTPAGALHVSRGLGTSFVPFRLWARPEATLLTLGRA